jgi:hypothetical protein
MSSFDVSSAPVIKKRNDAPVEAFFPDYRKHSYSNNNVLGMRSGKATLLSCLDCFTMPEILDEDNRYGCEVCTRNNGGGRKEEAHYKTTKKDDKSKDTGEEEEEEEETDDDGEAGEKQEKAKRRLVKTVASKQLLLCQLPKVLVVCLKRFKQTSRGTLSKNSEDVWFPADLDLSPYTFERPEQGQGQGLEEGERQAQEQGQERQSTRYSLNGIVEHSGGIHGGHYVAFIRTGKDWNYYSDSMGRKANEGEVLETEAYMLFYQQIPIRPAFPPASHSSTSSSSLSSSSPSSSSTSVGSTSEPVVEVSSLPLTSDVVLEVIDLPPSSASTEDSHSAPIEASEINNAEEQTSTSSSSHDSRKGGKQEEEENEEGNRREILGE